jgi:uncharacterized protein (DUF362 family)
LDENVVGLSTLLKGSSSPYADAAAVRESVREALLLYGLGRESPAAPLSDVIRPGMTVLLKPNWVMHRNYAGRGMECMVTHPTFITAVLEEVMAAKPGRVIVGDAPVQGCEFDTLVPPLWREGLPRPAGGRVEVVDFRRTVTRFVDIPLDVKNDVRDISRYVLFDLGARSMLEPISGPQGRFRVTNYDPDAMTETHHPGRHQYLVAREVIEADVILNLPKLKTHRKAGITAALKNLVGINGNKDYLPHHRVGGSALGGDCYPGFAPFKRIAERLLDAGNRRIGSPALKRWYLGARCFIGLHKLSGGDTNMEGGWFGNDTVWRMCLDLNRLLVYGRADGTFSETPLRKVYSLTDGIIGGEGEGPLAAEPVHLGAVTFASSPPFADLAHSALMRFDWRRVPIIREAFGEFAYPLANLQPAACEIRTAADRYTFDRLDEMGRTLGTPFRPPKGWKGHVERPAIATPAELSRAGA